MKLNNTSSRNKRSKKKGAQESLIQVLIPVRSPNSVNQYHTSIQQASMEA